MEWKFLDFIRAYKYRCNECGHEETVLDPLSLPKDCPSCNGGEYYPPKKPKKEKENI